MRSRSFGLTAALAAASLAALMAVMPGRKANAQGVRPQLPSIDRSEPQEGAQAAPRPRFADHSQELDDSDEIATLDAIHFVLTQVGDGSSYGWHRGNGHLSAGIHPASSFRDASGRICRHIVVILTTGARTRRIEGAACRLDGGRWQLEG